MQHAMRAGIAGNDLAGGRLHHDAFVEMIDDEPVVFLALREPPRDGVLMDGKAHAAADVAQNRFFLRGRPARRAVIDAECAQHLARLVFERHGPARAQAMRQSQRLERRPQRIGRDVLDDHHAPLEHGRAARPHVGSDGEPFDRVAVVLRQRWRGTHHETPFGVEQQDRASRLVAEQCLGAAAHLLEQRRQRRVARDEAQHRLLGGEHFFGKSRTVAGFAGP
jgi:hypothetical protein